MKLKNTLTTIFFSALFSIPLAAQNYPVRGIPIDSPKFDAIYRAVIQARAKNSANALIFIKITSHVDGSLYLAEAGRTSIAVDLPGFGQLVDDQRVEVVLTPTEKPYQYISILGAKITVPHYRAADPEVPYSKTHFLSDLQAGGEFPVTIHKKVKCPDCLGFPSASISRGECKSCDAAGFLNVPVSLVVVW